MERTIYVVLLVKLSNDCKCSLDELPKRVTMKVIKVKTIKMALGMIIVADSGASKFNQHLKLSLIIRFIVLLHYCILLFLGKEFQDSYFPDCWFGVWSDKKKTRLEIIVFMSVKIFFLLCSTRVKNNNLWFQKEPLHTIIVLHTT